MPKLNTSLSTTECTMYGNNSAAVRGFNAIVAVAWKGLISCVLGPGILYLDIASGTSYFQKAFEPYVTGSLNFTIPFVGWTVNWGRAVLLGLMLSAVMSGVQVMLWNLSKSGISLKNLKPQHYVAIIGASAVFGLDTLSDLGGATLWVSTTSDGSLWPQAANMFQMITIPAIVIAGTCNEAILDFFFGIDKPLFGGTSISQKIRGGRSSSKPAAKLAG